MKRILLAPMILALAALACSETTSGPQGGDPETPPIHVSIVTHNEEPLSGLYPDFVADEAAFWQHREKVVEFARMLDEEEVEFNYQSDWNFLLAAAMYDTGTVSTNGKNFLRFLKEDLGFGIDPHAHESSRNYADVACLIDSLGVEVSNIAGGFLCFPPVSSKVEYLRDTLHGWVYDFDWQAEVLWGNATMHHQNEDSLWVSGIWKPRDDFHFLEHDEQAPLPCVGGFRPSWEGLDSLLSLQAAGELNEDRIYTQSIMITQINLASNPGSVEQYRQKIAEYSTYADSGLIRWVQLGEVIDIWQTEYGSRPALYSWLEGELSPGTGVPDGIAIPAMQVWPNPSSGLVHFGLADDKSATELYIYDISGRMTRRLRVPESGSTAWNGCDELGREAPAGVYWARLDDGDDSRSVRFVLIR